MAIQDHYDRLGVAMGAALPDIKKAYRSKLKEFPAHRHPQEFKQIRASYEAIQTHLKTPHADDFFTLSPIEATMDDAVVDQLKQKATAALEFSLKDLIALTF